MTIITDILKGVGAQPVNVQSPLIFANPADVAATLASLGIVKPTKGNWLPSLGGNSVLDVQYATYIDFGEYVQIFWDLTVTSQGTGSLALLHGLPFPCGDEYGHVDISYYNGTSGPQYGVDAFVENNSSYIQILPKIGNTHGVGGGAFFATSMRCFGMAIYKKAV